jgi:hypothetical protein
MDTFIKDFTMVVNLWGKASMQPLSSELNRRQWVLNFMGSMPLPARPPYGDTNNLRHIFKQTIPCTSP